MRNSIDCLVYAATILAACFCVLANYATCQVLADMGWPIKQSLTVIFIEIVRSLPAYGMAGLILWLEGKRVVSWFRKQSTQRNAGERWQMMTSDELSAKVAEAMGEVCGSCMHSGACSHEDGHMSACNFHTPKPYAKCMNAAMELVEEAKIAEIYPYASSGNSEDCCVAIGRGFIGEDSTMPRAICRAYLAFKGVE